MQRQKSNRNSNSGVNIHTNRGVVLKRLSAHIASFHVSDNIPKCI